MFSGIAIAIYMKIDQVMLGQMATDHDVGIYSAAVRLSELWYFIPLTIVSSVLARRGVTAVTGFPAPRRTGARTGAGPAAPARPRRSPWAAAA